MQTINISAQPSERIFYKLEVIDGELFSSGEKLNGKLIFVMSNDVRIYAGMEKFGIIHHSSFLAGANVAAAGELSINSSVITLSARSGHYQPDVSSLKNIIKELTYRGFDIRNIKVEQKIK